MRLPRQNQAYAFKLNAGMGVRYIQTAYASRIYTTLIDYPILRGAPVRAVQRRSVVNARQARSPSIVTPVCPTWLGDEYVVRAHIPHASTTVSEQHMATGANMRWLALPTLNRVSRGLSRRAPPIIRRARHAKRLFFQTGSVYCDIPSYLDFRP